MFGAIPIPDECYYVEYPYYNTGLPAIPSNGNSTQWQVFSYTMPWYGRLAFTGYLQLSHSSGVTDITVALGGNTTPGVTSHWAGVVTDYDDNGYWTSAPFLAWWDGVAKGTTVNLWTYVQSVYNAGATVTLQYLNGSLRASRI